MKTVVLDGDKTLKNQIDGEVSLANAVSGECGLYTVIREGTYPAYTGPTEITPTQSEQVLSTANKSVMTDIVIQPIPNNYGLITWNGAILTVS